MEIGSKKNGIIILSAILWIAITLCGWSGKWFAGLIASVVLMLIYMMLGASKNGKLNKKLFVYPLLSWGVLWSIGFYFSKYYAEIYDGKMPDFTILGFHPSFVFTIFTYWLGGVLTLTLGFYFLADYWLSDDEWDNFKKKIEALNSAKEEL